MLPPLLIGPQDPKPVQVTPGAHPRLLIVCDHAGHAVPAVLNELGMPPDELRRHIGWDIGSLDAARHLARRYGATLVASVYSRLVIDLNRYPHDPASSPVQSDGIPVPGNTGMTAAARERRLAELFRPYHDRVAAELDRLGHGAFLLSVHTMTDRLNGGALRAEEIGISWCEDDGTAQAALEALSCDAGLTVGDNEPYAIDLGEDYTTPEHAIRRGLRHLQIEFRQDLVTNADAAARWAERFAPALNVAVAL